MLSILRHVALGAIAMCALGAQAQQDRNLKVHFSDNTTQTIDLANVDSLTFEKKVYGPLSVDLDIHATYIREMFKCSDPGIRYYVSYLEKENFGYTTDEEIVADDKQWMTEMAQSYDMDLADLINEFTYQGDFEEFQAELLPGHDYVLWMHGMDSEGNATTPVTKIAFRTKDPQTTTSTIALTAQKTDNGVQVACTPSDKSRYYTLGSIAVPNMKDEFTGKPLGTRDYMQTGLSAQLYDYLSGDEMDTFFELNAMTGDANITYSNLQSGVEYYIVAAYLDSDAAICSDITQIAIDKDGNVGQPTTVKAPARWTVGGTVRRHARLK